MAIVRSKRLASMQRVEEARIRLLRCPMLLETIVTVGRKEPISNDRSLTSRDTRRSCKYAPSCRAEGDTSRTYQLIK